MTPVPQTQPVVATADKRRLSATSIKSGGKVHMLQQQIKAEFLKLWRIPAFSISTILFPVLFFVLFGIPNARQTTDTGVSVAQIILASLTAYGLMNIALFSFGVGIAAERGQGWMKLVRATPMPAWIYFAAKLVMALLFAAAICLLMFPVAIVGANVRMPGSQWGALLLNLVLGLMPFVLIGFAIGYWAGPNSAVPIANVAGLVLGFGSGLLIPLDGLPAFMQRMAPYLPTYHYGQLVWGAVGVNNGQTGTHLLWLLGTMIVFGLLAVWGYRRDQGKQYG